MKKMKLFCGILIGFMILSSCSSDADSNSDSISIVGIWKPVKNVDVCSTGYEEVYVHSSCIQMSRITYYSDGTINWTENSYNNAGECSESFNENGTWTLNGDNLSITLEGETNTSTFFEITNDTLQIGWYDNSINGPCDGGNLPSHYYYEYKRVE